MKIGRPLFVWGLGLVARFAVGLDPRSTERGRAHAEKIPSGCR